MFLRNQFKSDGTFGIPVIKSQKIDMKNISFIGYDQIKLHDHKNKNKYVHFFLDDYKFEVIWNDPEPRLNKLKQYNGILAPQFSVYYTMPLSMQIYNTFRSRWCGAYLQSKGLTVIPTVSWGLPDSYWFCFDGVEEGSVVAVSTLGVKKEKDFFMQGYNEMLRRIKPKAVICYSTPFEEMKGNIITVDYAETNNLKYHTYTFVNEMQYYKKSYGYVVSDGMGGGGGGSSGSGGGGEITSPGFPGWDPEQPPGEGYEWRGSGDPRSGKGSWYNPKTKEKMYPDLEHADPIPPHWDYNFPGGGKGFRIYEDGTMEPKFYEGEMYHG